MIPLNSANMFGSEGSGNQKKFWTTDNRLVKLNSKYREADKEVSAYELGTMFGLDMVRYEKKEYMFRSQKCIGCECENYLQNYEVSIPFSELFSGSEAVINFNTKASEFFDITVGLICDLTHFTKDSVRKYIMQILVFDYIICNEDRHLSNFEIIKNEKKGVYRFAPIYDNGLSFLKTNAVLTQAELQKRLKKYKSMPFSRNPKTNLIDLKEAKQIAHEYKTNADLHGGILNNFNIAEFHRRLAHKRLSELLSEK
jgi:hypothetical protein